MRCTGGHTALVAADITGRAIKTSPQYKASLAYAVATQKGDVAEQSPLSSRATNERIASCPNPVAITERLKAVGVAAKAQLPNVHRIVERGNRAALLIDQRAWITMVKENQEWRSRD